MIIEKLLDLIERTFKREETLYIFCNDNKAFFTSTDYRRYKLCSCQNACDALSYLLDNISIRFDTKLYRQIVVFEGRIWVLIASVPDLCIVLTVGIPMGIYCAQNCVPLEADLFCLFFFSSVCYFSDQFRKIIMRYKRIGYNLNVMRQSACLVINPITVDGYAALFNCTPVDRASDSMMAPT